MLEHGLYATYSTLTDVSEHYAKLAESSYRSQWDRLRRLSFTALTLDKLIGESINGSGNRGSTGLTRERLMEELESAWIQKVSRETIMADVREIVGWLRLRIYFSSTGNGELKYERLL